MRTVYSSVLLISPRTLPRRVATAPTFRLRDVRFTYGGAISALGGLSVDISPSSITAIVGPSGCGKTTLLHLLAGLLPRPDDLLTGEVCASTFQRVRVGLLHQEPALLKHQTVEQNVRLLVDMLSSAGEKHNLDVTPLLELVGLTSHREKYPEQLSVGMKNRVAVARTFAIAPDLLLLDEPFAALDLPTRLPIYDAVAGFSRRGATTTVLVTHDVQEAVLLADEVIVLTRRGTKLASLKLPADHRSIPSEVLKSGTSTLELIAEIQQYLLTAAEASP